MDISASLDIQLNVECPYCDDYFNLFDEFPDMNDEESEIEGICEDCYG